MDFGWINALLDDVSSSVSLIYSAVASNVEKVFNLWILDTTEQDTRHSKGEKSNSLKNRVLRTNAIRTLVKKSIK